MMTILNNSLVGSDSNVTKQSKLFNCGDSPKNRANFVANGVLSSTTGSLSGCI